MTHINMRHRHGYLHIAASVLAALFLANVAKAGQTPAPIAITSPSNGAIVRPGQSVTVTVTSPASVTFTAVSVIGEGPAGVSGPVTSLPYNFTLTIPSDRKSGPMTVTALGITALDVLAEVAIDVDVEREDTATSIAPLVPEITFAAPGDELPIIALADFPLEDDVEVTASSKVTFSSSDEEVAVVNADGLVTAIAEGSAVITVTYTDSGSVDEEIPVTVPAAVFTLTPASVDFGNQTVSTSDYEELTVTNSSGYNLNITGIQTTGDFTQTSNCVSLSPLAPEATCTITVTFEPSAVGPAKGVMTVENDNETAGFRLVGTGVAP